MSHWILVAEDERTLGEMLCDNLSVESYHAEHVMTGPKALERMARGGIDLLILDVMLPGCNGYEVSRMLKEWMDNDPQSAPFPIMLLTARKVDTRDREKFIATWSRADACMYKPFEMEEIVSTIHQLTARRSA